MGSPKSAFSHNQPYGVNTIRKMMKHTCVMLGQSNCTGHGFRRLFITTLANDPRVSIEETMASSRHSSVAAQTAYIERNGDSEVGKFAALGLM